MISNRPLALMKNASCATLSFNKEPQVCGGKRRPVDIQQGSLGWDSRPRLLTPPWSGSSLHCMCLWLCCRVPFPPKERSRGHLLLPSITVTPSKEADEVATEHRPPREQLHGGKNATWGRRQG